AGEWVAGSDPSAAAVSVHRRRRLVVHPRRPFVREARADLEPVAAGEVDEGDAQRAPGLIALPESLPPEFRQRVGQPPDASWRRGRNLRRVLAGPALPGLAPP